MRLTKVEIEKRTNLLYKIINDSKGDVKMDKLINNTGLTYSSIRRELNKSNIKITNK